MARPTKLTDETIERLSNALRRWLIMRLTPESGR